MTAEQIRAEAIERIAKELFAIRRRPSDPDWNDPRPGFAWLWKLRREEAIRFVDALGDLLPIGTETQVDYEDTWVRYVTGWRAATVTE